MSFKEFCVGEFRKILGSHFCFVYFWESDVVHLEMSDGIIRYSEPKVSLCGLESTHWHGFVHEVSSYDDKILCVRCYEEYMLKASGIVP